MASPFPGVDPYLESQGLWPDFHLEFIGCWRRALLDRLPQAYDARVDERVYLLDLSDDTSRPVRPDVAVERGDWIGEPSQRGQAVVTLEPVTLPLAGLVEFREWHIRIVHREDRTLVAVLEVLSPTNKGAGQAIYLGKRADIITSPVHLVELDLLLGGHRLPMGKPLPPADYYALISRGDRRPDCDVFSWTVRDPLPTIPIPLLPPDPEVAIDLREVFELAYERGRYRRAIDYSGELQVRLDDADRQWAAAQAVEATQKRD